MTGRTGGARRVEVIGGGPGGLYAARLLKLRCPSWSVRVHERHAPDATFGFGIGLSPHTLKRMQLADPATYDELLDIGYKLRTWRMRIGTRSITGGDNQAIGLSRPALLAVLAAHAMDAGVEIEWGHAADLDEVGDADLVVAADGAGSGTRARLAATLGVSVQTGDLAYIWCGAEVALDTMHFEVVETAHGVFVGHVMPFAPDRVTFQVDARLDAVRRAGLFGGPVDEHGNDRTTLDYLSGAFAHLLGGAPLLGNRSVWSTFNTVRCNSWSSGNVVVIGDAAHTAHYTVGSGTRMAMEDALALVDAVTGNPEVPDALRAFEAARRPSTERLQARALRSQSWWASFRSRMHLPLPQLMVNYQTRTGAVGLAALAKADRELVDAALAVLGERPLADGDDVCERVLADRVVDGAVPAGAAVFDVAQFDDVVGCLDAAERARLDGQAPVAVAAESGDLDYVAAGILGGRLDLIVRR